MLKISWAFCHGFVTAGSLRLCRWHMSPASYGLCEPSLYRTGLANVRSSMKTFVTIGHLNVFSDTVGHVAEHYWYIYIYIYVCIYMYICI
jgi:hypothetical protein